MRDIDVTPTSPSSVDMGSPELTIRIHHSDKHSSVVAVSRREALDLARKLLEALLREERES